MIGSTATTLGRTRRGEGRGVTVSIEVGFVTVTGVECELCDREVDLTEEFGTIDPPEDFDVEFHCDRCDHYFTKTLRVAFL